LLADTNYQQAAAEYLSVTKTNAAYERFETSLLVAFDGMKHMVVLPANQKPNIFELRTYLSPSEGKGLNKVQMFDSGEIPLMKEVHLGPIFYGRVIAGTKMPCLTYLLSDDSLEAHKQHWQEFNKAAIWKNLQADPQYKDNVSAGISIMLKSTTASQI
jgi:NIPSNAP